ncbi:MAG: RNA degradosome polyphosphate kinase, partial [Alphaproteobacteria bacterium]
MTPAEQLVEINQFAGTLMEEQQRIWRGLRAALRTEDVVVVEPHELSDEDRRWLENRFMADIFPVLTPLAVDPAHPFPFIPNLGLAMALQLNRSSDSRSLVGLLPLPAQIERFLKLPGGGLRFILLEKVISVFLHRLFPGFELEGFGTFRVIRDSDIEILEEAEDLVRLFETALKRRRRGNVIRLTIDGSMPDYLREFVIDQIGIEDADVFVLDGLLGLDRTAEL